jgi:hypothetical protein
VLPRLDEVVDEVGDLAAVGAVVDVAGERARGPVRAAGEAAEPTPRLRRVGADCQSCATSRSGVRAMRVMLLAASYTRWKRTNRPWSSVMAFSR